MAIENEIRRICNEIRLWRQHFHRHPETAYEETGTARFIAEKLTEFGLVVHQGMAVTGVVGCLSAGDSQRKIALRADMDALFIQEQNQLEYKSVHDGKMHACGHDGHCAMLLGAAKYLAENPDFNGTVYFVFQPAEEARAGAEKMIAEGLFELFPVDMVFGLHNFPDVPTGHFAIKAGALMASFDCFEISLKGQASHAAMPHLGNDAVVVAAQIITALQTIVSRNVDPADSAVVTVTQIHGGHTWNAIPESVVIRGTFRCFNAAVQNLIKNKIEQIAQSIAQGFSILAELAFNPENPGYPVTINSQKATEIAIKAASAVVGAECVDLQPTPSMGSEDFAFMLQEKPGCYVWLGNGSSDGSCLLHNPNYDFNDEILPVGVAYWVELVRTCL